MTPAFPLLKARCSRPIEALYVEAQQRAAQRAVAHTERNPQQQYELGCRLEREGEDVTRPVADREADLQQAVGWFRAAAFQVQSNKISVSTLLRTLWHLLTRLRA